MTTYSPDFTVKSNARRAARKAGLDPSTVSTVVKAGKKLYRFPLDAPDASGKKPKAKAAKKAPAAKPPKAKKARKTDPRQNPSARKAMRAATRGAVKSETTKRDGGLKFIAVAALLRRPGGASMNEVVAATGWKPHSARARISVDVSKLLAPGEEIQRRREEGVSWYSIVKSKQMELPGTSQEAA